MIVSRGVGSKELENSDRDTQVSSFPDRWSGHIPGRSDEETTEIERATSQKLLGMVVTPPTNSPSS